MSKALRMSEDSRRNTDDGDARRDITHDDGAGADDATATDRLARNDAGAAAHKDAIGHADVAGDITLGAQRGPRSKLGVVANGAIEIHHSEIPDLDVHGEDGAGADDHAFAKLHPGAEMGLGVDEGREFRAGGDERGDELLLERRHPEAG